MCERKAKKDAPAAVVSCAACMSPIAGSSISSNWLKKTSLPFRVSGCAYLLVLYPAAENADISMCVALFC